MENFKQCRSHYDVSDSGRFYNNKFKRFVNPRKNSDGYLIVTFSVDGVEKCYKAHRLIAEAFISNPEDKQFINHINGDKTDNRIENLEWCTSQENRIHAINVLGIKPAIGSKQHLAKLDDDKIREIRIQLNKGISPYKLAPMYDMNVRTIYRIKDNETWKHVINT